MHLGTSRSEAQALANLVLESIPHAVTVEPEDGFFVVVIKKESGDTWSVRDQDDWAWLKDRIAAD